MQYESEPDAMSSLTQLYVFSVTARQLCSTDNVFVTNITVHSQSIEMGTICLNTKKFNHSEKVGKIPITKIH